MHSLSRLEHLRMPVYGGVVHQDHDVLRLGRLVRAQAQEGLEQEVLDYVVVGGALSQLDRSIRLARECCRPSVRRRSTATAKLCTPACTSASFAT